MSTITKPILLDETGQRIVDAIKEVAGAINPSTGVVYGFHVSSTEADPSARVTYLEDAIGATPAAMNYTAGVFDYGSWADAFFMPRPCMLKSSGVVDYYLDPNDLTKKEDGTASDIADTTYDGNAMMEWGQKGKKIWMKIVPDADHLGASIYIADHQEDSLYHDWPFHNVNGVSVDHFYTPIYNGTLDSNNKVRSLSGQALMKTQIAANEISYAQANNPGNDIMWNTELFGDIMLINNLLTLMGKSTNHQAVFGEGLMSGGTEAINDNYTTGVHNAKGLFYGTNSGTISDGNYGNAVKVFGMENWWGLQWRRYQGHIMDNGSQKVKNTYGTEDGSTASGYSLTGSGFKTTGATALSGTSGGYIKDMYYTEDGAVPCGELSGSSSTYYSDACWYNNAIVAVPLRGGHSTIGSEDGSFCADLLHTASIASWTIGAALSCKPLA